MRNKSILLAASFVLLAACQSQPEIPVPTYSELTESLALGAAVEVEALRKAFKLEADYPERLSRLLELEEQALAILEDEPLKLGAIGSAILDNFYASLTGHYAMLRFYEHVGSDEAAAPHQAWLGKIRATMDAGEGSVETPFAAMTRAEARTHLALAQLEPVGGIYQSTSDYPFMLMLIGKPSDGALERRFYDVTPMYEALMQESVNAEANIETTPFTLIGLLARESDTSAQAAVGAYLARLNRTEDAIGWLRAASRSGNVLANTLLARMFFEASRTEVDEAAKATLMSDTLDNYVHAIALGSSDAMYALAALYLGEQYGVENVDAGIPLLQRAAKYGHSDAMLYLAHLHSSGQQLPQSNEHASRYFVQASELGNRRAMGAYARFLVAEQPQDADTRIIEWLEQHAALDDAEAMLLLGNLHARGLAVSPDSDRSLRWFKKAVKVNPEDPNIVNEVAWTLTVSDVSDLPRPSYAKKIMDSVMKRDDDARSRPEYLDTWAATHAANGDFEAAIELQEKALARAKELQRDDVLDVLEEHLEKFRNRQAIVEPAP